jgi:tetratricopeptide (TPR) repeat protein
MRSRLFSLFALAVLLLAAGCDRSDISPFTVEGDEPGYRRGKDLIKQGRNQEALSEFQKVIEKRGLNNAPESHLEVGLLYQYHIKDPIAAIYHYRKFRELKPNSQQADLVRQRIDAATRDFARSLPAQPLENQLDRLDMSDYAQRLQRENDKLKTDLASAKSNKPTPETAPAETTPESTPAPAPTPTRAATNDTSPVMRAALETEPAPAPVAPVTTARPPATQPVRPPVSATTSRPPASTPTTRPAAGTYRRCTIAKGDTLFSLAQKYYGNRSRWRDIYAANRDVMKSEGDLRIGMELKIPQ